MSMINLGTLPPTDTLNAVVKGVNGSVSNREASEIMTILLACGYEPEEIVIVPHIGGARRGNAATDVVRMEHPTDDMLTALAIRFHEICPSLTVRFPDRYLVVSGPVEDVKAAPTKLRNPEKYWGARDDFDAIVRASYDDA